jgi:hypothetical protein
MASAKDWSLQISAWKRKLFHADICNMTLGVGDIPARRAIKTLAFYAGVNILRVRWAGDVYAPPAQASPSGL